MEEERVKFEKIFSNLPKEIRNADIIVVVDDKPYTWDAAYLEIKNKTELGNRILKKLKNMKII